jgi:hydrogenase-1 operon protein HyaF
VTRLADIPVQVELGVSRSGLGGGITALLSELANSLDRLSTTDECTTIDLRSLPLSPEDRMQLQQMLGEGEVTATLNAEGESTIRETSFAGIWWVEHRSRDGELVAELLEVTRIPAILASAPDEISAAAEHMKIRLRPDSFDRSRTSRE